MLHSSPVQDLGQLFAVALAPPFSRLVQISETIEAKTVHEDKLAGRRQSRIRPFNHGLSAIQNRIHERKMRMKPETRSPYFAVCFAIIILQLPCKVRRFFTGAHQIAGDEPDSIQRGDAEEERR